MRAEDFLIARGGPFDRLQRQLHLLHEDAYRAPTRAALFVALAWGVPLILCVIAGTAWGPFESQPYLLSLTPWTRFFVAIGLFLFMERAVDQRLRTLLAHFEHAPVLERKSFPAAAEAVARALKRRDSVLAEVICIALAILASVALRQRMLDHESSSWAVQITPEGTTLTPASWWCLIVSNPLFVFLVLRWLWRLHLWAALLRQIASLDLRLVATHPDGCGGLAFIGRYTSAFTIYVFAISCVLGAGMAHEMLERGISTTAYTCVLAGWMAIVLGLLAYPLLSFRRPLSDLKTQTFIASSAQATEHFRVRERQILGRNSVGVEANQDDEPDVPDPSEIYSHASKLSTNLFSRSSLFPVAAAALLPLAAAGATQLPMEELIRIVKRLLLL